jgi:hypothetical protein
MSEKARLMIEKLKNNENRSPDADEVKKKIEKHSFGFSNVLFVF